MPDLKDVAKTVERSNEIVDIQIKDEHGELYVDGAGTPATIGVVGLDSKHYRAETEALGRRVARMPKVEQERVDWRRGLAACGVVRWSGWSDGDTPAECTREHVEQACRAGHILDQVETGIKEHARFFATRSTS